MRSLLAREKNTRIWTAWIYWDLFFDRAKRQGKHQKIVLLNKCFKDRHICRQLRKNRCTDGHILLPSIFNPVVLPPSQNNRYSYFLELIVRYNNYPELELSVFFVIVLLVIGSRKSLNPTLNHYTLKRQSYCYLKIVGIFSFKGLFLNFCIPYIEIYQ